MTRVVIIGGGPGGYEAALVGAQLGASVTVVDRDGLGGAAVLTDVVPSKTLIATSDFLSRFEPEALCYDIIDPTDKTVDALMKLDLPAGVDVEIKL